MQTNVVVVGAARTPVGTLGGALSEVSAQQLGTAAVVEALKRAGVQPAQVDDVLMGIVMQSGLGMNVARQIAIKAGIPVESTASTVNLVCGSGLRAIGMAAQSIAQEDTRVMVAGGTESMSRSPYVLNRARFGYRLGHSELIDSMIQEALWCSIENIHMGVTAENVAEMMSITREEQDAFAAESQAKAARAMELGLFNEEIVPIEVPQSKGQVVVVDKDEHPRPGTTAEKLGRLRPAFKTGGTVTAGNASGINDGAAAVVMMSTETAEELGVQPRAKIIGYAWAGIEPRIMGLAPVNAIRKVLDKTDLKLSDIELIELNEAFAAQSIGCIRQLGLDPARVNVNGGAIALGHPVGASGARIFVTLLHEMTRRKVKLGMASMCVGGGQGAAIIVENLLR